MSENSKLKVSNVIFTNNSAEEGYDVYYYTKTELETYKSKFRHGTFLLSSNDKNFTEEVWNWNIVSGSGNTAQLILKESQYASGK